MHSMAFFGMGIVFISGAIGQNFDLLTRRSESVLCGTNGLQARRPLGHLQRFLEGTDRLGVLRTFGQQAQCAQAQLAFADDRAFLCLDEGLVVLQDHAVGERVFDRRQFFGRRLEFFDLFFGLGQFFGELFKLLLRFRDLFAGIGQFAHHMAFAGVAPVSQGQSACQQQTEDNLKD